MYSFKISNYHEEYTVFISVGFEVVSPQNSPDSPNCDILIEPVTILVYVGEGRLTATLHSKAQVFLHCQQLKGVSYSHLQHYAPSKWYVSCLSSASRFRFYCWSFVIVCSLTFVIRRWSSTLCWHWFHR